MNSNNCRLTCRTVQSHAAVVAARFHVETAAAAAGYTLAAGPVRADVIQTDANGLDAGDAKIKVAGGRHAGLLRAPVRRSEPADHSRLHGDLRFARIHQGRHAPPRPSRRFRSRAGLLFPSRASISPRSTTCEAVSDRQYQDRHRAVRRSRRHRGLGEVAGRRRQPARHHGLLPRRPERVALFVAQSDPEGRRRILRHAVDKSEAAPKSSIELAPEVKEPVLGLYGAEDAGIKVAQVKRWRPR